MEIDNEVYMKELIKKVTSEGPFKHKLFAALILIPLLILVVFNIIKAS